PPSPLAGPDERLASVEPVEVVGPEVDPGFVLLRQNRPRAPSPGIGEHNLVPVLLAAHVLQDDLFGVSGPFHEWYVTVARITQRLEPAILPARSADHADANCRVRVSRLRVEHRLDYRIERVRVVDQIEVADAFRIELPVGDRAAVGTPAPANSKVELL